METKKVVISVVDGEVSLVEKPDYVEVEVRDYITVDDDETYPEVHKDESGDTYRVFSFPAETAILETIEVDEPISMTNFYKCVECGTEWQDEWSCACDDDCPKCNTTMTPYKSEDFE